jgi:hypothetical protein
MQETRRHRRLVKKAAKLDVRDLLDICAMRGMAAANPAPVADAPALPVDPPDAVPEGAAVDDAEHAAAPDQEDAHVTDEEGAGEAVPPAGAGLHMDEGL